MTDTDLAAIPLAEKVRLLTGASTFTLRGHERLRMRPMAFSDGHMLIARGLDDVRGGTSASGEDPSAR